MSKTTVFGLLLLVSLNINSCSSGLLQKAEAKYFAQEYQTAANLLEMYLTKHPGSYTARKKMAHSLLIEGQVREAVVQFEKVINDNPQDTLSHLYLGLAYLRLGEYKETLSTWNHFESGGRPLLLKEMEKLSNTVAKTAPNISNDKELYELVNLVESAIEMAFFAEEKRNAYNAFRLGECG